MRNSIAGDVLVKGALCHPLLDQCELSFTDRK